MYRIITSTSTTREEHFESPNAAAYGMTTYCGNTTPIYGNTSPQTKNDYGSVIQQPPQNGNIKVKNAMENEWGGYEYWNEYHCWGDLMVHGTTTISSDLIVEGTITGRGSTTEIKMLDADPTASNIAGNVGELAVTDNYMYLCVSTDSWIRWPIQSTW